MTRSFSVPHRIKLFLDSADLREMEAATHADGFTTNPTLMRQAGVTDAMAWAREAAKIAGPRPLSLEAWDERNLLGQASKLAEIAENVVVKIPVTDTAGRSTANLLRVLCGANVRVNVTGILTLRQVGSVLGVLETVPADQRRVILSVFAGRIADTGRDPVPVLRQAATLVAQYAGVTLLWASAREALNVLQAESAGCDAITLSPALLAKIAMFGTDLTELSLATVRQFHKDAIEAGYRL